MGVYIKNWSLADWKELLKWAKIGANNAMIGEFAKVEEVPPHGRMIAEADAVETTWMILRGLGYLKEENPKLEQTVREVFATAPAIEVEEHG